MNSGVLKLLQGMQQFFYTCLWRWFRNKIIKALQLQHINKMENVII